MQYVSDFDQAAANHAEIAKMEKYIVDLEIERKTYFRRSQADKKKKIEAGKTSFPIDWGSCSAAATSALQTADFENLDQKIHYWADEIKKIRKKSKFFYYIETAKNTHRIIKDEFSKNNQTYYACKGDLFFIRTDILRKGYFLS